jgi:hypothetical protein
LRRSPSAAESKDRTVHQEIRQDPRRHRRIQIQAGRHTIPAADPLPDDLLQGLETIARAGRGAH